jgi:hypothetical protein
MQAAALQTRAGSSLAGLQVLTQPLSEFVFSQITGGQGEHRHDALRIVGCQVPSIEGQKQLDRHESATLVTIDKWLLTRQVEPVGRRQRGSVRLTMVGKMQRSVRRQFKQALVANTTAAAVLSQLLFV